MNIYAVAAGGVKIGIIQHERPPCEEWPFVIGTVDNNYSVSLSRSLRASITEQLKEFDCEGFYGIFS
jgi:hypothetical protein